MTAERLSLDFWKFWAGQTISNLGSSFTAFALPLLVFKLTHSPVYWPPRPPRTSSPTSFSGS